MDLNENHLEAKLYLAKCFIREHEHEKANELLEDILAVDPTFSGAHLALAQNCFETDKNKSIEYCKNALALNPNDAIILNYIGYIYLFTGSFDEALHYLKKARKIRDRYIDSFFIGLIYYLRKDLTNAKKYFSESKYLAAKELEKARFIHWISFSTGIMECLECNTLEAKRLVENALRYNQSEAIKNEMKNQLIFLIKHEKNNENLNEVLQYFT